MLTGSYLRSLILARTKTGVSSFAGTALRLLSNIRSYSGVLTSAGSVLRTIGIFKAYSGILSFVGSVSGVLTVPDSGTLASVIGAAASVTRLLALGRIYNGVLSSVGAISRYFIGERTFAGVCSFQGVIDSFMGTAEAIVSEIGFAGSFSRQTSYFRSLNSVLAPTETPSAATIGYGGMCMDMSLGV